MPLTQTWERLDEWENYFEDVFFSLGKENHCCMEEFVYQIFSLADKDLLI